MVTPVFRIFDYPQARDFYIGWLGFRVDWEELTDGLPAYVQVSRDDVVLHLSCHLSDGNPGAKARAEVRGLPAYHHQLMSKEHPPMLLHLGPAYWNERVLEMEVIDPFGNRVIFCEPGMLQP
jgi:catechol 2,3-dioxygenase-like lactoylglutathione lyase family enzyme